MATHKDSCAAATPIASQLRQTALPAGLSVFRRLRSPRYSAIGAVTKVGKNMNTPISMGTKSTETGSTRKVIAKKSIEMKRSINGRNASSNASVSWRG